jgi:hypothetical protein
MRRLMQLYGERLLVNWMDIILGQLMIAAVHTIQYRTTYCFISIYQIHILNDTMGVLCCAL